MTDSSELKGLGGWLILVGFGVTISPLLMGVQLHQYYQEVFASGFYTELSTPGSEVYNTELVRLMLFEVVTNVGLCLGFVYLAVLFYTKRRAFPKWFIGITLFTPLFLTFDHVYLISLIPEIPEKDRQAAILDIIRTVIHALIWVPYMLVSRRVKATFVE